LSELFSTSYVRDLTELAAEKFIIEMLAKTGMVGSTYGVN